MLKHFKALNACQQIPGQLLFTQLSSRASAHVSNRIIATVVTAMNSTNKQGSERGPRLRQALPTSMLRDCSTAGSGPQPLSSGQLPASRSISHTSSAPPDGNFPCTMASSAAIRLTSQSWMMRDRINKSPGCGRRGNRHACASPLHTSCKQSKQNTLPSPSPGAINCNSIEPHRWQNRPASHRRQKPKI